MRACNHSNRNHSNNKLVNKAKQLFIVILAYLHRYACITHKISKHLFLNIKILINKLYS